MRTICKLLCICPFGFSAIEVRPAANVVGLGAHAFCDTLPREGIDIRSFLNSCEPAEDPPKSSCTGTRNK